MIKLILSLAVTLMILQPAFAEIHIAEVSFLKPEFVMIHSSEKLNLSGKMFYDDAGIENANVLQKIKSEESGYYLIVGYDFLNSYNISNLNCSIYKTSKNGLGHYGLKSNGENFVIIVSNSTNLSWEKKENLNFSENQTLQYNKTNDSFHISEILLCPKKDYSQNESLIDFEDNLSVENNKSADLNETEENEVFENPTCNYSFEIESSSEISTDRLRFSFETNSSDYIIEYWIEDFGGNLMKSRLNTTNPAQKQYTPRETGIYVLHANLHIENCDIFSNSKTLYYYKNSSQIIDEIILETEEIPKEPESSYIKILNREEIESGNSKLVEYEIYRGENELKRVVYIYHNRKTLLWQELERDSKIKGKVGFFPFEGTNRIFLSGLGFEEEVFFLNEKESENLTTRNIENQSIIVKENDFFKISNFEVNRSKIFFSISSNFNFSTECYTVLRRTKVSSTVNITQENISQILIININNSRLLEENIETLPLKFYCKYVKENTKTFRYESFDLNYTVEKEHIEDNSVEKPSLKFSEPETFPTLSNFNFSTENKASLLSSRNNNIIDSIFVEKTHIQEKNILEETIENEIQPTEYSSKGISFKENSFFLLFGGILILFLVFLFKW